MTMRLAGRTKFSSIHLYRLCIIFLLMRCLPSQSVSADMGPKPTMAFTFAWETAEQPTILEGQLAQCDDPACVEAHPLEEMGPQYFACSATACDSMAYSYAPYAKLTLRFSDGVTRESNIFEKSTFKSQYEVNVRASDLVVSEKLDLNLPFQSLDPLSALMKWVELLFGLGLLVVLFALNVLMIIKTRQAPLRYASAKMTCISVWVIALPAFILGLIFARSLPLTLAIEGVLISLYAILSKQRWFPWITVITLGNLLTQVFLLTVTPFVSGQGMSLLFTVFAEIFIWLIETILMHLTLRRQQSILPSLGISLVLNVVSLGIGMLLPM